MSLHSQRKKFCCTHIQTSSIIPWWRSLISHSTALLPIRWSHNYSYCSTLILNTKQNRLCYNHGHYLHLQSFLPFLSIISDMCTDIHSRFSWLSRRINTLYAFTTIRTTGEFINFSRVCNVRVSGCIYHRMLDLSKDRKSVV